MRPILPPRTPWLTRYAAFTTLATLGLIGLGGLVTSHGAGMAVPDWPTTYGYNMFLFPISQWVGGIFYEHTHRLYASGVGLLTVILATWIHLAYRDAIASGNSVARTTRRAAWMAVGLVIVQGVLGGLRVRMMRDQIGILHAGLAQVFLVLLLLITVRTSAGWHRWVADPPRIPRRVYVWAAVATGLIFVQLLLGASMRHQHAGLAIPDFPTAYGHVWPPTDADSIAQYNARRLDHRDFNPITAPQIYLHLAHRLLGVTVVILVTIAGRHCWRHFAKGNVANRLGRIWSGLVWVQVLLGAATVWFNKPADIATAHVVVGATCLAVGAWVSWLCRQAARVGAAAITAPAKSSTGLDPVGWAPRPAGAGK